MFYMKCITLFKTYWPKRVSMQSLSSIGLHYSEIAFAFTVDNPDCLLLDRAQMCIDRGIVICRAACNMEGGQQEEKIRQPN